MNAARRAATAGSSRRSAVSALLAGVGAAVAAAILALVPATSASAHDYLVSSTPAANSTVSTAVPSVTLTFDDIVLDDGGHGALVQVTDASGRNFETGCATVQARNVTVPVALGAPGQYRVTWQIVSADGHPVSSSIQFDYTGPKAGDGHEGPLAKCGTTISAPAAQGTSTPAPGASTQASLSPTVITIIAIAGGIVLLAVIAVVLVIVLSSRRKDTTD